jgi:hypothetical protein
LRRIRRGKWLSIGVDKAREGKHKTNRDKRKDKIQETKRMK